MRRVDFTKKAQQRFQELHDNISENQSPKVAKKFVEDFNHTIKLVQQNPEIFAKSAHNPNLRRGLFSKYGGFFLQSV
ncbi:MAG: type II toxin-antitoxin system RelE/ParE family toxin [Aureispira sp.]